MQNSLKEILSNVRLDFSTYANLPAKEEILVMEPNGKERVILKQWEKLQSIRKNLKLLDDYLKSGVKDKFKVWLTSNGFNMSTEIVNKIGNHNDETGGITAFFLDVQNFYDEQEEIYDKMELGAKLHDDLEVSVPKNREEREEKRKNRRKTRKIANKNLKADDKGYLNIVLDESDLPSDGGANPKGNPDLTPEQKEEIKKVGSNTGKIIIGIVGISIAVAVIYNFTKKEE